MNTLDLIATIPRRSRIRYYLFQAGRKLSESRGFQNREQAAVWINQLGEQLYSCVGFSFYLKGQTSLAEEYYIGDKNGLELKR